MNIETLEDVRRLSELCPPLHDNGIRSLGSMAAADGGYIPMYACGGAIPRYGFGSWLKRHTKTAKGIGALLDIGKYAGFLAGPLGPAISGASAALKKKYIGDDVGLFDWKLGEGEEIGGDSWKDALLSGAKSAALTYLGGKALKGAHSSVAQKAYERALEQNMEEAVAKELFLDNLDPSAWGGLKSLFTGYEGTDMANMFPLAQPGVTFEGALPWGESALAGLSGISSSLMDPKNQFFTYPALSEIDRMQQAEEWRNQAGAMGSEYGFGDPSYQAAKDAAQADFDRMRGRGSSLYTYRRPVLPEVTALANLGVAGGGYIPRLSNGGPPSGVGVIDDWEQMLQGMGMAPAEGSDWLLGWANTLACGDPNCNRWGKGDEHLAYAWVNKEAVNPGTGHSFWTSGLGGKSPCQYSGDCNIWTVLNQGQVPPGGWPQYFDEITGSSGAPPAPPWLPNKGPELPTPGFRDPIMPHHEYRPGFQGEYQYFMPREYDDQGNIVRPTGPDPSTPNPYTPGTPEWVMWNTPKTEWQAGPAGGGPPIGTHPQDVDMSMPPMYDDDGNQLSDEAAQAAWLASLGSTDPMYKPPKKGIIPCPEGQEKDADGNCVAITLAGGGPVDPRMAAMGPPAMAPPGMAPPAMASPGMGPAMPQGEGVRGSLSQEEIGMALEQLAKAISEGDEAKLDMMFEYFGPELFQQLINILMGEQRADADGVATNGGLLDDKGAGPRADDLLASVNGDPILLSGDEFVVNARATGELGPDNLQAINDSPDARRFVKSAMDSAGPGQMGMMT